MPGGKLMDPVQVSGLTPANGGPQPRFRSAKVQHQEAKSEVRSDFADSFWKSAVSEKLIDQAKSLKTLARLFHPRGTRIGQIRKTGQD